MSSEVLRYETIPWLGRSAINAAIRENNVELLRIAALSAALNSGDGIWAEMICHKLISNSDGIVRGNAALGLGHIARVFGSLDRQKAVKALKQLCKDEDEFVRGQAEGGLEDVRGFLKRDGTPRFKD